MVQALHETIRAMKNLLFEMPVAGLCIMQC